MELFDLEYGLNSVGSVGNTLNVQEITGIQSGLMKLKCDFKFSSVYFWGKIFADAGDYYVAYGLSDNGFEFPAKQFYYALDVDQAEGRKAFEFVEMPQITEDVAYAVIEQATDRRFTGNPGVKLKAEAAEGEGAPPPSEEAPLTEEYQLAQVVQEIDFDTAVVPKGAYTVNEQHQVVRAIDFKGLGFTEAGTLGSYLHFRPPTSTAKLRALARDDVQFFSAFLDPLAEDLPKGCWAIRKDPTVTLVTLRSLNWEGYVGFHVPGTAKFGGVYFGYGTKNRDLPFLL